MRLRSLALAIPASFALLVTGSLPAQEATAPRTRAEATNYAETSSITDVQRFFDACVKLPHGDRLEISVAGKSNEGRPLLLAKVALPGQADTQRLRALIIGNIHAGEVEGKEAVQQLAREFANGKHTKLLERCDVWLLPIYNVDGNEKTSARHRRRQNGPRVVGQRPNAQGLDLNRDFVKAEAPETRTLLALFDRIDPHLFMDLHTTNGSYHGYHLTFAPCLSPNQDRHLARVSRELLDDVTARMKREHEFEVFDYGNFETRDWDGSRAPESPDNVRGWYTYDSRPRYGINYYGLRNRISILSEAYSYCDFQTRTACTRAFVLTTLQSLTANRRRVLGACQAADQRLAQPGMGTWFGYGATFGAPEQLEILVGKVERYQDEAGNTRLRRTGEVEREKMPVLRAFRARNQRRLPDAWGVPNPSADTIALLKRHGIEFEQTTATRTVRAERFRVSKKRKPKRPFQGHQELVLEGTWEAAGEHDLPAGSLVVSRRQRLAMLAAQLLEPESDDGLSNWNYFEAQTDTHYPVLRMFGVER
ncbi:MAG: M14 family metallopeptidase [bacterium]|nr:M14 family metallopeptidase [bacterium]